MRKVSRLVAFVLLIPSARRKTQWNLYLTRRNEICTPLNRPDFSPNLSGKRGKAFRFTNAWEQRKIGDYLTLSKIPGYTGVDAKKLTVKLWGKGVVEKTDIYGGSQNTQYYVRRAGQFMYGKLDFLHAAFGIVPKSLDRFESTLDSPAFDLHEIDGAFLQNRVTQQNFYLKFGNIANGSRKAKRIHEVTFLDMPIVVPSYAEQKKIGAFLNKLDSLLTLHQRQQNGGYLWLENSAKQVCFAIITASGYRSTKKALSDPLR